MQQIGLSHSRITSQPLGRMHTALELCASAAVSCGGPQSVARRLALEEPCMPSFSALTCRGALKPTDWTYSIRCTSDSIRSCLPVLRAVSSPFGLHNAVFACVSLQPT